MKNRAKCKLCKEIIESFHYEDYVSCKCGEIAVDGGSEMMRSRARDYANFLRVDDEGNEIIVTVIEKDIKEDSLQPKKATKEEILSTLNEMIKRTESLPIEAMLSSMNQYDYLSILLLMRSILIVDEL